MSHVTKASQPASQPHACPKFTSKCFSVNVFFWALFRREILSNEFCPCTIPPVVSVPPSHSHPSPPTVPFPCERPWGRTSPSAPMPAPGPPRPSPEAGHLRTAMKARLGLNDRSAFLCQWISRVCRINEGWHENPKTAFSKQAGGPSAEVDRS